jgi:energy-coupling factor transporter ATP-binding protein EcfA2
MRKATKTYKTPVKWDICDKHPLVVQYKEVIIKHAKMETTMHRVMTVLSGKTDPGVVLLVGATGVGKSTLIDTLERKLMESTKHIAEGRSATNPIVWTRARPPEKGKFGWRDYLTRALIQAGDVLTNRKVVSPATLPLFDDLPEQVALDGNSLSALRQALENCLRYRKTRFLVIDEAQYLLLIHDNHLAQQLETIKSLAEEAGVVIILVGTYRLLEVQNQSAQLVRRSQVIAFSRYHDDEEEDVRDFAEAAFNLYDKIPIKKKLEVEKTVRFLYKQSCGCVGILKDWFTSTLSACIRENQEFNLAQLKAAARANKDLLTIHREAMDGESGFRDMSDDEFEVELLKLKQKYGVGSPSARAGKQSNATTGAQNNKSYRAVKSNRVGKRHPKRDPVGDIYAAT